MDETTDEKIVERPEDIIIPKFKGRPVTPVLKLVQKKRQLSEAAKADLAAQHQQRLIKFLDAFIANGGNATQAAYAVSPYKNRLSAMKMGYAMLQEVRPMAAILMEEKGWGYGRLMEIAMKKAENASSPEWWDRLMKMAGYEDFMSKEKAPAPQVVNIVNAQKGIMSQFVEGEIDEESDK